MTGFEILLRDRIVRASIGDEGVLPVIIDYVNKGVDSEDNGAYISVSALDDFEYITWLSEKIDDEEQISVKVVDVKNNSPSVSKPKDRAEMLEDYRQLKNKLETEGLL
jgi:hypothetical protein